VARILKEFVASGIRESLYFAAFRGLGGSVEKNHDKVFFVTFGVVLGALGVITAICIIAANLASPLVEPDAAAIARLEDRIRPVGTAITDAAALLKVSAPAAAHKPQTPDQIMNGVCGACHGGGLLGAPKVGDKAAWAARASAKGGLNGLTASAIKGMNAMPPRGGADLTDAELKATVELMLKQSGV
jgi:cytochrome c5